MILGYHRIAETDHDPFQLCVSPENFRRHLEELRRRARPTRLSVLVQEVREGAVTQGSVALTFDDAYRETLDVVEPILAEFDFPATIFVPTGALGREQWWDRLQRLLSGAEAVSRPFNLQVGNVDFHWGGSPEAENPDENAHLVHTWERLLMDVYRILLVARDEDREAAMAEVSDWAGAGSFHGSEASVVTEHELRELAGSTLIEIGSHSVSHPLMAELPKAMVEREVRDSKRCLEDLLGRRGSIFSYPNGSRNAETDKVVREAGFLAACASQNDAVTAGSDLFHLPRFWPGDSPEAVSQLLGHWVGC
jgi:peptidoglycan/xylan/chitin deacetylase (PgdA/CDA1 family)